MNITLSKLKTASYSKLTSSIALSTILLSALSASAQSLSHLSVYSVITSGDFQSNSDVEGRTLIGGDLIGGNSMNFGIKLQGTDSSELTLRVAGDIQSGNPIQLNAGSLELGGSTSRNINYNGGGSLVSNPGVSYASVFNDLDLSSNQLASMTTNSYATLPGNQPSAIVFNATPNDDGIAVFSYDASDIFSNSKAQSIDINTPADTDIVINIAGFDVQWTDGNFIGDFNLNTVQERVIWNFYEATSIDFGGRAFSGQVLAPNAHVTSNGVIDGSIYAASIQTNSEVHLPTYREEPLPPGFPLPPTTNIPEPSSTALLGLGALGLLLRRNR